MSQARARGPALACFLLAVLLAACGGAGAPLSGVAAGGADGNVVRPSGRAPTEPIRLSYTLGQPSTVTLQIQPSTGGDPITLRAAEPLPAGAHFVLFDGSVPTGATPGAAATQVARVLPDGSYRFHVQAQPASGGPPQEASADFRVEQARTTPPGLDNLQVYPAAISPNGDAVDDVALITYRLSETSTTGVTLQAPGGAAVPIWAPIQTGAGEQRVTFNGQDLFGRLLPNGTYTVTVRTADLAGNAVEARRTLTIAGAGAPSIVLREVTFDPPALMLGGKLHVRMVVENVGDVPLRTEGPDPGYTYTTNDSYSSVEGGRYAVQAGLWRVGVDWQGNAGGAPYRYPFRWGFGQTLAPGASATIDGYITVLKQERTMWFYAGVLQEGVSIVQDQLGLTPVQVSW